MDGVWAKGQNLSIFAEGPSSFDGDVDIVGNLHVYQEVIVHTNLSVTGDLCIYGLLIQREPHHGSS
jgi:hypothetical protein